MGNSDEQHLLLLEKEEQNRKAQLHAMRLEHHRSILCDQKLKRILAIDFTSTAGLLVLVLAGTAAWLLSGKTGQDRWQIGMLLATLTVLLRMICSSMPTILASLGRR